MPLTNVGRNHLTGLAIGEALTAFSNANARLGVGDSNTVFAAAQTDLQAAANKFRKAMDATYPQRTTNVLTFRASFATGEANFAWEEVGIFNAAAAGEMLNRKVQSLGTKVSGVWELTATITVNNP